MVVFQSIWGQLLDAVVLGVIFARISYPKQRARTIFISDSAVIARRDSQLKFMFRIGDIRQSTVRGFPHKKHRGQQDSNLRALRQSVSSAPP